MTRFSLSRDRAGGLLILLFSVVYGALAFDIPILAAQAQGFTAATMPKFLAACGIVLSVVLLARADPAETKNHLLDAVKHFHWGRFTAFLVLMSAYGLVIKPFGFLLSTTTFLLSGFWILGERRALLAVGVALAVAIGFWALMTLVLGVHLEPWPDFGRRSR